MDLKQLPNVCLDIRYATSNNFMGQVVRGYNAEMCWMHRDGFEMLRTLTTTLEVEGFGLWIWDAYRPKSATQHMLEWVKETNQQWILDEGFVVEDSRHNRGRRLLISHSMTWPRKMCWIWEQTGIILDRKVTGTVCRALLWTIDSNCVRR